MTDPIFDSQELSPQERELLRQMVKPGEEVDLRTKIPDAPDISEPQQSDPLAEDAEFFVEGRYRPHGIKSRTGVAFEIVQHPKEKQHLAFDEDIADRYRKKGLKPPPPSFYVRSPRGAVGWVPWVGSVVAWPWEAAWAADLVERGPADPKPGKEKR